MATLKAEINVGEKITVRRRGSGQYIYIIL